jgi:iron complex outermembrane receptor protein
VDDHALINARLGFAPRAAGLFFPWSRNLFNRDYFELLSAAPGNTGRYVGQPGDCRTVGLTLRLTMKK